MSFWDKLKGIFGDKAPEPAEEAPPAPPAPPEDETSFASVIEPERAPAPRQEKGTSPRQRTTRAEDRRIEAEARALFAKGDSRGGIAHLGRHAILFARHEEASASADRLPCLCRECLEPELSAAEAQGVAYQRDFVVSRHHAFFYWTPKELADDAKRVRHSMRAQLRLRLKAQGKEPKESVRRNPFTGQMQTFPAPGSKRRANPFGSSS